MHFNGEKALYQKAVVCKILSSPSRSYSEFVYFSNVTNVSLQSERTQRTTISKHTFFFSYMYNELFADTLK